jgi:hypothetical protein
MLELKLHVEFDRVSAKSHVVRWIDLVSKSQLEAKLLGVELNRPLDVARAENRVGFFESQDTVQSEQRSLEKRGLIYRTGSFAKGTQEAHRSPRCSANLSIC